MDQKTVRTRFAPSPTGYLHIGGLRTCLFNYLLAKANNGQCILRIEDTDQTRFVPGAADRLIKVLNDLGMRFDEGPITSEKTPPKDDKSLSHLDQVGEKGPYIQSQRTELYRQYAQKLIDQGDAYYCFATPEELEAMREEQIKAGLAPMYDRRALRLTSDEIDKKLKAGTPHVIRLKMPRDQKIEFKDAIHGKVSFMGNQIDDQILIKSDGLPTYHLANVVDDHLMDITHVIRGDEWLASTPKHLVMYRAFGWEAPIFAHIPLILNADRSKLSKRQNDVSVESYLEKGYLKEALLNFVALLGWHPGKGVEKEIFKVEELIKDFKLENVNKSGAVFDVDKLNWFNQNWRKLQYFKQLDVLALELNTNVSIEINKKEEHIYHFEDEQSAANFQAKRAGLLLSSCDQFLDQKYKQDIDKLNKALISNEEKIIRAPEDVNDLIHYLFAPQKLDNQLLINQKMGIETVEDGIEQLAFSREKLAEIEEFEKLDAIKNHLLTQIAENGKKNGQVLWPLRAALTHEQYSIGAFESAWVLGKTETLKRLDEILN